MKVGILALQGAFREHAEACSALGADVTLVKRPEHLAAVDAVVLPGGESTTQEKLLASSGLREPLARALGDGMPCLATCAGVILLARTIADGRPDQEPLGVFDIGVRRNGYGRQVDSFEADLDVAGLTGGPFHGVFIRAPRIESIGDGVDVLAQYEGDPVLVRSGLCVGATFHPELSGDLRLHQLFLERHTS
jgi:5'-phosphate synthase pdxT subunit